MNIREKVSKNLKDAMIKKETNLVNTLRLMLAAIKEKDIISKGKGDDVEVNDRVIISWYPEMEVLKHISPKHSFLEPNDLPKKCEPLSKINILSNVWFLLIEVRLNGI